MKISSNHKIQKLLTLAELPESARSEFDYIGDAADSPRFVLHRGSYYDCLDTQKITTHNGDRMGWAMVVDIKSPLAKWQSVVSESYFSGVLFKFKDNGVICGVYTS
jgi:hypothetical protein